MSRLRRIEHQDRMFFVTTNVARGVPPLSCVERDLVLRQLDEVRGANRFLSLATSSCLTLSMLFWCRSQSRFRRSCINGSSRADTPFSSLAANEDRFGRRAILISYAAEREMCRISWSTFTRIPSQLVLWVAQMNGLSARFHVGTRTPALVPDIMDFSGDPDELLWPPPWRRL